uniref:U3 small nucleolar RNA-associated protein 18 homolog n=1 Tax=Palpitomonas bilix TaxID=652834 RepID=A0A7S3D7T5_9EUKA|mmetsp:Transcript_25430/g.63784  ORF Transcript_25430/g.63784 Transcript_25430/m.63784 type:complete len:512 (+) Transcript_25430:79-1614(+)
MAPARKGGERERVPKLSELEEEKSLEKELFGDGGEELMRLLEDDGERMEVEVGAVGTLPLSSKKTRAWVDEDDESMEVNVTEVARLRKLRDDDNEITLSGREYTDRLRRQFLRLHPTPEWAELPSVRRERRRQEKLEKGGVDEEYVDSDESDGEDMDAAEHALISNPDVFLMEKRQKQQAHNPRLPSDEIQLKRMKDANADQRSEATVLALAFHPDVPLMLTAGLDKSLRLFSVDGARNPLVQSVFFEDMPIYNAEYSANGREIILAGRRKYFYSYDLYQGKVDKIPYIMGRSEKSLESFAVSHGSGQEEMIAFMGKDGNTILVSQHTKQWVNTLKMNGTVRSASFSADGKTLTTFGDEGEVYIWDLRTMKCSHRFEDEGCVKGTSVALSNTGKYIAAGSDSGVVNIYNHDSVYQKRAPSPMKSVLNLTTDVHRMRFNHDDQLLAITSKEKKDQLRLVHLPTMRVFSNWPTDQTPLGYVSNVAFSANSGYAAIGNDKGKVLLYRLRHFPMI